MTLFLRTILCNILPFKCAHSHKGKKWQKYTKGNIQEYSLKFLNNEILMCSFILCIKCKHKCSVTKFTP